MGANKGGPSQSADTMGPPESYGVAGNADRMWGRMGVDNQGMAQLGATMMQGANSGGAAMVGDQMQGPELSLDQMLAQFMGQTGQTGQDSLNSAMEEALRAAQQRQTGTATLRARRNMRTGG